MSILCKKIILCVIITLFFSGCESVGGGGAANIVEPNKQKALETHLRLGFEYIKRKNRDGARRHFEKALEIAPRSASANNGMAVLFQLNGEVELAEARFKKAIRSDSSFTQARYNYGTFLYTQDRHQEAYDEFTVVVKDLSYNRRALSLAILGQIANKLDKPERAKSSFEHALNLEGSLPLAAIELADIYFTEGDYAKASSYLKRYQRNVRKQTAKSLWLGIRLERIFGNEDKKASYIIALRNLHPYSKEYLMYKEGLSQSGNSSSQVDE